MYTTIDQTPTKKESPSLTVTGIQMKALVYHGARNMAWEEKPKPIRMPQKKKR